MRPRSSCLAMFRCRPGRAGFSLVELLVALAAIALLAAVALPTFFEQLARTRRTDVQAALLEDAAYLQHYYASHDAFAGTPAPQLPFERTPRQGAASYAITVSVPTDDPSSFVLVATRAGAMASDACGDLTYDSLGRRQLVAGTFGSGRNATACWR